jgi:hypothetical protein
MDPESFDPGEFMRGFNKEIVSLQMMAVMRGVPRKERPIREGGLVPSPDGFRWLAS